MDQNSISQSDTNKRLERKIADLETTLKKNAQEVHRMQQEQASSFQRQLDAIMDMQQQFQSQLTRLETGVQNLKL